MIKSQYYISIYKIYRVQHLERNQQHQPDHIRKEKRFKINYPNFHLKKKNKEIKPKERKISKKQKHQKKITGNHNVSPCAKEKSEGRQQFVYIPEGKLSIMAYVSYSNLQLARSGLMKIIWELLFFPSRQMTKIFISLCPVFRKSKQNLFYKILSHLPL